MKSSEDVRALWHEAKAAGAGDGILDELGAIEASLPAPKKVEPAEGWAPVAEPGDFVEVEPGVYAEQGTPAALEGEQS